MVKAAKKIAQGLSLFVFFILLLVGIFSKPQFRLSDLPAIGLKAFIGYVIFWMLGIVVSDIVIKAILMDVEHEPADEGRGGLLTRFSPDKNEEVLKTRAGGQ